MLTSRQNSINLLLSAPKLAALLYVTSRKRIAGSEKGCMMQIWEDINLMLGVPLTTQYHCDQLNLATLHHQWRRIHWNNVLFTDDSSFNLEFSDGCFWVWCCNGEHYDTANIVQHDPFSRGNIMVWSSVARNGRTDLVTVQGTLNAVRYTLPHT